MRPLRLLTLTFALLLGACDSTTDDTNTAPTAEPDTYDATTATLLEVPADDGILSNDEDPEGAPLSAELVTNVSNGTLTLATDGGFQYVSHADFTGADTFTYMADDGHHSSQLALVTLNVTAGDNEDPPSSDENTPPTAFDLTWETPEDTARDIHLKGRDADGDTLTFRIMTSPSNGTLPAFDPATGRATYTPAPDFAGTDSFTYEVSDAQATATGTVTITVTPVNDPPSTVLHAEPTTGEAPLTVQFDATASSDPEGPLVSYDWTFGDGTHATGATPEHTYNTIGHFTATLTVADADGATNSTQVTIDVTPTAPTLLRTDLGSNPGDLYGNNVAMDNDTAVVGAPGATGNGWTNGGLIYIYERTYTDANGEWAMRRRLDAPVGASSGIGRSIDISGDTIAAGASDEQSVFLFSRNEGGDNEWGQIARIDNTEPHFGGEVAISGDHLVVGTFSASDGGRYAGAAYIYYRHEGGTDAWGLQKKITASDAAEDARFGTAVDIHDNLVIIGASTKSDATGAAYLFERDNGGTDNWGEVAILQASDAAPGAAFGHAVAVSDANLIIGAPGAPSSTNRGRAYVFTRDPSEASGWRQTALLHPAEQNDNDQFGGSVAIASDKAIVGTFFDDEALPDAGAAHVYYRTTDSAGLDVWIEYGKLMPPGATGSDHFGRSVAISSTHFLAGAEQHGEGGSAFLYAD